MSGVAREDLLDQLPVSHRVRGGDLFRRFVFLIDEELKSAEARIEQGFGPSSNRGTDSLADGFDEKPASAVAFRGSALDVRLRFQSRGLPLPQVWPGLVAETVDKRVVFQRTLSRALVLVWTTKQFEGCGDPILAELRKHADWLPVGTSLSAAVVASQNPILQRVSGSSSAGQVLLA